MVELQKQFIAYEQKYGVDFENYYNPTDGHTLKNYREEFAELANQVIDLAHQERGSKR